MESEAWISRASEGEACTAHSDRITSTPTCHKHIPPENDAYVNVERSLPQGPLDMLPSKHGKAGDVLRHRHLHDIGQHTDCPRQTSWPTIVVVTALINIAILRFTAAVPSGYLCIHSVLQNFERSLAVNKPNLLRKTTSSMRSGQTNQRFQ